MILPCTKIRRETQLPHFFSKFLFLKTFPKCHSLQMFLISIPTQVLQNCHRTLITALLILKNGKTHLHTFSTPQPIDKLVIEPCQIQIQHVNSLFRSTFLNTFHRFLIPTPMIIKAICQQIFRLQKCNESFSNNLITSRQKHNLFQRHLFCLHQNHSKNF